MLGVSLRAIALAGPKKKRNFFVLSIYFEPWLRPRAR